jgi:hypothetical protein
LRTHAGFFGVAGQQNPADVARGIAQGGEQAAISFRIFYQSDLAIAEA